MAKAIVVVGPSGSGKSTSIRNLNPAETFIINVAGKDLPFRPKGFTKCETGKPPKEGNIYDVDNAAAIFKIMTYVSENRPEIKHLILDDAQYIFANEFMRRISEKSFDKFNDIGKNLWSLGTIVQSLREDLILFYLMHEEDSVDASGRKFKKVRTIGKLVDDKISFEGMFTMVLWTEVIKTKDGMEYTFKTQNESDSTAKTPMGMFNELNIPNDLAIVSNIVREFYEI